MGADFSKFQRVLISVLQIRLADNLKGLKTQPKKKSAPKTKDTNEMYSYGMFTSLFKNKTDHMQFTRLQYIPNMQRPESVVEKYKYSITICLCQSVFLLTLI
jgi:hypothetical protein